MATPIEVKATERDVWLTFQSRSGNTASLSVAALADGKLGIVGKALREWAAEQIEAARHYHVGPGDTCGQCGFDIRNTLHKRVGE
jgi:hypothetical protein